MKLAFIDMFSGLTIKLSLSGFGKRQIRLQHEKLPLCNTYLLDFTKKLLRESTFLDNKVDYLTQFFKNYPVNKSLLHSQDPKIFNVNMQIRVQRIEKV